MSSKPQSEAQQQTVKRVKACYRLAKQANEAQHARSLAALKFCDPQQQWDSAIKNQRDSDHRPCLTVDRINPFVRQLCNDQRQNRQAIQINPVGDGADVETAEVLQGLIRHIEQDSKADIAYDRAYEAAVRMGFGFMRVYTDYCEPDEFEQDIKIGSIYNPFMAFLDPSSTEPDGSDAKWGGVAEDYTADEYKVAYPNSALADATPTEWESIGDNAPDWVMQETDQVPVCRVIEFWDQVKKPIQLVKLASGRTMDKKDWSEELQDPIVSERESFKVTVKWCKVNAIEVLEESEWPSKWIPLVPVYGDSIYVDGKVVYLGLVDSMMDVQRMVNYWKSAQTEMIALSPKAPWIVAEESIDPADKTWANANIRNYNTLRYKAFNEAGKQLPPPFRSVAEPAIQAITEAMQGTENDLKAVTNMYDPSLGRNLGDQSGTAIRQLQHQGQTANYHFADNLTRSMRHVAEIIMDARPKIYDTPRIIRIIRPDDTHELIQVNQELAEVGEDGQPKVIDLTKGKYSVTVSTGPSYATKRQEESAFFMNLLKADPQLISILGDLALRTQDSPGAIEAAERLKKMLPPQLQDQKNGPDPAQLGQQLQQAQGMIEKLTEALKHETELAQGKQSEIQAKILMNQRDNETKILVAELAAKSRETETALQEEMKHVHEVMDTQFKYNQMAQDADLAQQQAEQPESETEDAGETAGVGADNA